MATFKFQVVNKVTFARLYAEAWERSTTPMNVRAGFRVTGICPFSPGCLPEMAFATCFQEVISVPAHTELDASGRLQPCGSDEPLPCGFSNPQPSGSGKIEPVELMVVDSSEVSALPYRLEESGPGKPEAWIDHAGASA
ncbi:hypothetical protein LSH36_224g03005 [Paralvinella palmiformis]|uniref:Uncharacterized protein n=1 Tax=Paralvinella palmiformis TaxID=53620 RepID=A0AAD9JP22_9ANNE|nr:hypothetical protein LSH36_224g03005 [Paralvinella palmiformis]